MPFADPKSKVAYEKERRRKIRDSEILSDIRGKFSEKELRAIIQGRGAGQVTPLKVNIDLDGDEIKFGFITDSHCGSIYYREDFLDDFIRYCKQEGADFVVHGGDVTNGMDQRKYNLLFESTHIGYAAQKEYAVEQIRKIPFKTYLISGNHDNFFMVNGARIVEDICKECPNAIYLGDGEGDIYIGGIIIRVWHGEDGSSYATSYRLQKLIESFTGGEKPNVLLAGHVHKQGYFYERMVHAVSGGALCTQSKWMRGKRLANHSGYHFIRMKVNEGGVATFTVTWRPFYE